jgi:tetratricopeptide (TPR) repeat protein
MIMKKLYILTLSLLLSVQPLFAAMTGGGGSSSSSSSNSSSSSSSSNASSSSGYSNSSYSSTEGSGYSSKKDRKKKEFDPFESIYGLIRLEKFAEAHESLKYIRVLTPSKKADKYNLLGFTARKSGNLNSAADYYSKALEINPKHIQALEYQGELYLQLGDLDEAKKNLEKIKTICWFICKEKKMLEEAIKLASN